VGDVVTIVRPMGLKPQAMNLAVLGKSVAIRNGGPAGTRCVFAAAFGLEIQHFESTSRGIDVVDRAGSNAFSSPEL